MSENTISILFIMYFIEIMNIIYFNENKFSFIFLLIIIFSLVKTNHIQIKKDNMKKKFVIASSDYYLKYKNFKAFEFFRKKF